MCVKHGARTQRCERANDASAEDRSALGRPSTRQRRQQRAERRRLSALVSLPPHTSRRHLPAIHSSPANTLFILMKAGHRCNDPLRFGQLPVCPRACLIRSWAGTHRKSLHDVAVRLCQALCMMKLNLVSCCRAVAGGKG